MSEGPGTKPFAVNSSLFGTEPYPVWSTLGDVGTYGVAKCLNSVGAGALANCLTGHKWILKYGECVMAHPKTANPNPDGKSFSTQQACEEANREAIRIAHEVGMRAESGRHPVSPGVSPPPSPIASHRSPPVSPGVSRRSPPGGHSSSSHRQGVPVQTPTHESIAKSLLVHSVARCLVEGGTYVTCMRDHNKSLASGSSPPGSPPPPHSTPAQTSFMDYWRGEFARMAGNLSDHHWVFSPDFRNCLYVGKDKQPVNGWRTRDACEHALDQYLYGVFIDPKIVVCSNADIEAGGCVERERDGSWIISLSAWQFASIPKRIFWPHFIVDKVCVGIRPHR